MAKMSQMCRRRRRDIATENIVFMHHTYVSVKQQCLHSSYLKLNSVTDMSVICGGRVPASRKLGQRSQNHAGQL